MYATLVGKTLKIPSIISERGDPAITLPNTFKDRILKLIIDSASGGVFQTNGAKDYYGKRLQKRGSVIPNPILLKEPCLMCHMKSMRRQWCPLVGLITSRSG